MGNRKKLDVNSYNYATSLTAFRDYLNNLGNKTLVYNREEALAIVFDFDFHFPISQVHQYL